MKQRTVLCVGVILLGIYWYLVMDITGATPTNFLIIRDFAVSADISLIPFADMQSILGAGAGWLIQIGGNILMFMPLGFLLPFFWQGWRSAKRVIGFGFAASLFIEWNQLFNYRASTTDDLILNTIGAILGFGCYQIAKRIFGLQERAGARAEKLPVIVLLCVWGLKIATELPIYLKWIQAGV